MVSRLVGRIVSICVFVFLNQSIPRAAAKPEPDFGPNVLVFDPSTPGIQEKLDAVFATQERGEFNSRRYAILLKPGKYNLDVKVGFYTQILGLGRTPDDVSITGAVRSNATWRHGNATINFWRCVENLSVNPPPGAGPDVWAVSQGTALRRVHVRGDLNLSDHGWSSGGFIADSRIDGIVDCGTQQQWLSRNAEFGSWHGGNWNMVFVGVQNPPPGMWPDQPYTTINATPVIREKPYLFVDDADNYCVRVPPMMNDSHGVSWTNGNTPGDSIPIDRFYLAHPNRDNAASINAALESGRNLLLMPGIYHLEDRIRVRQSGTVVLGLGYPTLISENGTPAMIVSDAGGIEIGGILFQAGPIGSPALLEVGPAPSPAKHADDPICLYDIFCRSGGAAAGKTDSMVTINANNVIGDNSWLWHRPRQGRRMEIQRDEERPYREWQGCDVLRTVCRALPGIPDIMEWRRWTGVFLPIGNALRSAEPEDLVSRWSAGVCFVQGGRFSADPFGVWVGSLLYFSARAGGIRYSVRSPGAARNSNTRYHHAAFGGTGGHWNFPHL